MAMRLDKWYAMRDRQEQEYLSSPIKRQLDEAYLRRNQVDRVVMDFVVRGDTLRAESAEKQLRFLDAEIETLKRALKTETRRTR
jgi:hypothetical protein